MKQQMIGLCFAVALMSASLSGVALAAATSPQIQKVLDFDAHAQKFSKPPKIAYLAECVNDAYCQANLKGLNAAAEKFNFSFKTFDAQFNPSQQLKDVQNAVAGGFDAYVLGPTASAQTCSMYGQYLKPTGKPVVVYNMPMCGDHDATPGVSASVFRVASDYYNQLADLAFASCKGTCEAAAVGGYVGSDLFNDWESALASAQKKYPNVKLVINQPANFDPQTAARIMQDGLSAHPNISIALSPWDDMTRGIIEAVKNSGKAPGKDVKIFSDGATKDGIKRVRDGDVEVTGIMTPYEEGYYSGVAIAMSLQGHPVDGFVDLSKMPEILSGPGRMFITRDNESRLVPKY